MLWTVSAHFAMTGLHGATALTLASTFETKLLFFRQAIEMNSQTRIRSLDSQLSSLASKSAEMLRPKSLQTCRSRRLLVSIFRHLPKLKTRRQHPNGLARATTATFSTS
jgi:hypothetical protein